MRYLLYLAVFVTFCYYEEGYCSTQTVDNNLTVTSLTRDTVLGLAKLRTLSDNEPAIPFSMMKQNIRGPVHYTADDKLQDHCFKPTMCQSLTKTTCLGANLPYTSTSFSLVNGTSLDDIEGKLSAWTSLKRVPKCWAALQSFLCAIHMPRCENGSVVLPPVELCRKTRIPCRIMELSGGWPDFMRCENEALFPTNCKRDVKEIKFNNTASCQPPLVETDQSLNWFTGVDGCGAQCYNPLVSSDQHKQIHSFIAIIGSLCLSFNLLSVFTFLIDWRNSRRYPAVIIFYINGCYLMACIGWLAQFTPESRNDLVCHRDGTARKSQPSSGETLSCVTVFILIYYFMIAASIWFVLLSYAWDFSFRSVGVPRKAVENKSAYFHLAAWCVPFVMTIALMAMKEVDSDSVYGICFVGYSNSLVRLLFLFLPVSLAWLGGSFFLVRGFVTLLKVKFGGNDVMSHHVKSRIKNMIVRLGLFILFVSAAVVSAIVCHVWDYLQQEKLALALQQYVFCLAVRSKDPDSLPCKLRMQPNLLLVHLQLLAMFGSGIAMSSWIWTGATFSAWRRFLFRICNQPSDEPIKLKRHKMIAQAFAQRQNFGPGQLSLTYDSTHEDPVGMNLEINSLASRAPSSTWAAALPKFLIRRGAISGSGPLGLRRYSSTSDISQCPIPLAAFTGRRHSMDSQNSMQMSEKEWIATAAAHAQELARQRRRKTRKERERFIRGNKRISPWLLIGRRGSDTSQQSSATAANNTNASKIVATKVTKSTSTGDLAQNEPVYFRPPTALVFPIARSMVQRQPIIIPPFTHGMAENSLRVGSNGKPLISPNIFAPPKVTVPKVNGFAIQGQILPTHPTYMATPPLPTWASYAAIPIPYPTYVGLAALMADHEPILPLNPMPDSCSEAEFIPIVMSDSDFTDTGFKSQNEDQLLNAKLVQERIDAIVGPCHSDSMSSQCNSTVTSQGGDKKISFLKKLTTSIEMFVSNNKPISDSEKRNSTVYNTPKKFSSISSLNQSGLENKRQASAPTSVTEMHQLLETKCTPQALNSARSLCFTPDCVNPNESEDALETNQLLVE